MAIGWTPEELAARIIYDSTPAVCPLGRVRVIRYELPGRAIMWVIDAHRVDGRSVGVTEIHWPPIAEPPGPVALGRFLSDAFMNAWF